MPFDLDFALAVALAFALGVALAFGLDLGFCSALDSALASGKGGVKPNSMIGSKCPNAYCVKD